MISSYPLRMSGVIVVCQSMVWPGSLGDKASNLATGASCSRSRPKWCCCRHRCHCHVDRPATFLPCCVLHKERWVLAGQSQLRTIVSQTAVVIRWCSAGPRQCSAVWCHRCRRVLPVLQQETSWRAYLDVRCVSADVHICSTWLPTARV